ncbi:MAG: uroporphyrinogen decarboxylase [Verrucomicrobia bacterium]|nr:uroporphyrinogen decarboxylase [Verrucomicrobiota bacterium]
MKSSSGSLSKLLDALAGNNRTGIPPIWLMRQAGRYLPEYRHMRKKHSFLELIRSGELLAEVTLLPLKKLPLDAAIIFSDLLTPLDMLGVKWSIEEEVGPVVEPCDVNKLSSAPALEKVSYLSDGIKWAKQELKVPLLGFCGAPFTVASYLIEGKSSKTLTKTRAMLYQEPANFAHLLDLLADVAIDYLKMQIDAGVDALQLFDSWADFLTPSAFARFALPYWRKIHEGIGKKVPLIFYCRGAHASLEQMAALDAPLSLDWQCDLFGVRKKLGPQVVLQGNLDPCALFGPPEPHASALLQNMGKDPAFIFNLGHGILPETPLAHVERLIAHVKGGKW